MRTILLALLMLIPARGLAEEPSPAAPAKTEPAWEKLTAVRWKEIVKETYGPPNHWDASELFPVYAAEALDTLGGRYAPPLVGRRYNGWKPAAVGEVGAYQILVDAEMNSAPLDDSRRQDLKDCIDWLSEHSRDRGVLLLITPQVVGEKGPVEIAPDVVRFGRSRRVFIFQAVAEYRRKGGGYFFRLGIAENLTGEFTRDRGNAPEPLAGKAVPADGIRVEKRPD
jgi:hypothetical protein